MADLDYDLLYAALTNHELPCWFKALEVIRKRNFMVSSIWTAASNFKNDKDYTNTEKYRSKHARRGGHIYVRPGGSYRYGLALNRWPPNDPWLSQGPNGWLIAYHGTDSLGAQGILKNGFQTDRCFRDHYSLLFNSTQQGIYSAADPIDALGYSRPFKYKGKDYKLVFQVRINPTKMQIIPHGITNSGDFYRVEDEEAIRPFGICIFKVDALDGYLAYCDPTIQPAGTFAGVFKI